VVNYRRKLRRLLDDFSTGGIAFSRVDASIKGWVNHVCQADSWGLRRDVFGSFTL
jgi:RNA-directed DNA polymerase